MLNVWCSLRVCIQTVLALCYGWLSCLSEYQHDHNKILDYLVCQIFNSYKFMVHIILSHLDSSWRNLLCSEYSIWNVFFTKLHIITLNNLLPFQTVVSSLIGPVLPLACPRVLHNHPNTSVASCYPLSLVWVCAPSLPPRIVPPHCSLWDVVKKLCSVSRMIPTWTLTAYTALPPSRRLWPSWGRAVTKVCLSS